MFHAELRSKLKAIFGFEKVTYQAPSDAYEQDTLFVEITGCISNTGEGTARARVTGNLIVFSQIEKIPFGFFNKRIQLSELALTRDLFLLPEVDVLTSPARFVNISERRAGFLYLYASQWDPEQGELTGLTFEEE